MMLKSLKSLKKRTRKIKYNAWPSSDEGCHYSGSRMIDNVLAGMGVEVITKTVHRVPAVNRVQVVLEVVDCGSVLDQIRNVLLTMRPSVYGAKVL